MKFSRIIRNIAERNIFLVDIIAKLVPPRVIFKIFKTQLAKKQKFKFKSQQLSYFYHSYNEARFNERTIEVPIVKYYIQQSGFKDFLEIGNVTNHYYTYFKDLINSKIVIDKYEKGWKVVNKDIKNYNPDKKFDFIFSISTFEHMDSDQGKNPDYVAGGSKLITYAADNLVHVCNNLLKDGGYFIITTPIAYRREWDITLFSGDIINKEFLNVKSLEVFYYKKINELEWIETSLEEAKSAKFNDPFPGVNIISIIEIIK